MLTALSILSLRQGLRYRESPSRAISTLLFEPRQPAPHKREKDRSGERK